MNERDVKTSATESGASAGESGIVVLHVDDDPNDTALLQAASRKAKVDFKLVNAEDGEQAITFLTEADRSRGPLPALVLLDMKMPRATGLEILRWIRQHPNLNKLPVVVLSGSELQEDIEKAQAEGANSYLVKPLGFEALVDMIRNLSTLWLAAKDQTSV